MTTSGETAVATARGLAGGHSTLVVLGTDDQNVRTLTRRTHSDPADSSHHDLRTGTNGTPSFVGRCEARPALPGRPGRHQRQRVDDTGVRIDASLP